MPTLADIIPAIEEITEPRKLGVQLKIEPHILTKFEIDYPKIDRQIEAVITHWQNNSKDCSWEALAEAVKRMGNHSNLVEKLQKQHSEATKNANLKLNYTVTVEDEIAKQGTKLKTFKPLSF